MLWKEIGYKSLKESFEERTKTSKSSHIGEDDPGDTNDDTLVNSTSDVQDHLRRELKHFINTSIIAERKAMEVNT